MNNSNHTVLQLEEFEPACFPKSELLNDVGHILYRNFGDRIEVEFPSPKTENQWQFKSLGWVGYFPITKDVMVSVKPKAPLHNIFRMWEYAYRLKSFHFLKGIYDCQSLEEFFENLANILARKVLDRRRKGLYRAYVPKNERLMYLSGRIDVRQMLLKPWNAELHCNYEDHTADIEENQIISWTLGRIARSRLCRSDVQNTVRRAHRDLLGAARPLQFIPADCIGRVYNRLNNDYEPLHALCRFFLEHKGPQLEIGDHRMVPFMVDMARLYELFVAEWLLQHLPKGYKLKPQETLHFSKEGDLRFTIDLILYEEETGQPIAIMDTKYKVPQTPSTSDIHEVRSYAEAVGCYDAVLIYPKPLPNPKNEKIGNIRLRTLTFSTEDEAEDAGQNFLDQLFNY